MDNEIVDWTGDSTGTGTAGTTGRLSVPAGIADAVPEGAGARLAGAFIGATDAATGSGATGSDVIGDADEIVAGWRSVFDTEFVTAPTSRSDFSTCGGVTA